MDIWDKIGEAGIRLTSRRRGNHKTLCPQCSANRKHKTDPCLSVLVESTSIKWNCFNCGWKGGIGDDLGERDGMGKSARHQHQDFGTSRRRLRYGVHPGA